MLARMLPPHFEIHIFGGVNGMLGATAHRWGK